MALNRTLLGQTSELDDVALGEAIRLIAAHHTAVTTTATLRHALLVDVAVHHLSMFLYVMLAVLASGRVRNRQK